MTPWKSCWKSTGTEPERGGYDGAWELAPAYDLTNDQTLGEHASTVNYKGHPTDDDMIAVGMNTKMSRARCLQIIDEVRAAIKDIRI